MKRMATKNRVTMMRLVLKQPNDDPNCNHSIQLKNSVQILEPHL